MLNAAVLERRRRNTIAGKLSSAGTSVKGITSFSNLGESLKKLSTMSSLTIIFIEILVFSVLCLLYLAFSNKYITQGYIVNKLESERETLIVQNEVSNRRIEEAKSLSEIRSKAHKYMVYSSDHIYLDSHDTVAVAR